MLLPSLVPDHHHCPSCSPRFIGFLRTIRCSLGLHSAVLLCRHCVPTHLQNVTSEAASLWPHFTQFIHWTGIVAVSSAVLRQSCCSSMLSVLFLLFARSVNRLHFTTRPMTNKVLESWILESWHLSCTWARWFVYLRRRIFFILFFIPDIFRHILPPPSDWTTSVNDVGVCLRLITWCFLKAWPAGGSRPPLSGRHLQDAEMQACDDRMNLTQSLWVVIV